MLLIVNADDLGATDKINDEVFALMQSGLVTSATIMANAAAFEDAAKRSREFPHCSFGIHLVLTSYRPISDTRGLEPILDENGCFSRKLFQTAAITRDLQKAMLRELSAQVQRTLDAGIPLSHFDSHHHVHIIPKMFPVLKALQKKFGMRKVRSTINLFAAGEQVTALRSIKKSAFRFALRHFYATRSPEGFGDFRVFHAALTAGKLPQFRSLELMVHPGTINPVYSKEVECLRSDWQRLLPPGAILGSYHGL